MARKGKRISAREFSTGFTKVVSQHLSALSPADQDKRIKAAERTLEASCAEHPTTHKAEETPAIRLLSRNRK